MILKCLKLLFGLKAIYWTVCQHEKTPDIACLCLSAAPKSQHKKHCDWTGFCRVRKLFFPFLLSSNNQITLVIGKYETEFNSGLPV